MREGNVFARVWAFAAEMYYRYTLEMGTNILEWWEAMLVNLYVLLLAYSLAGQAARTTMYLMQVSGDALGIVKSRTDATGVV